MNGRRTADKSQRQQPSKTFIDNNTLYHLFDKLQLNVKADIMMLDLLPANNLADNPMGIDKQFIYGNSLVDAVILQLGLLGNY